MNRDQRATYDGRHWELLPPAEPEPSLRLSITSGAPASFNAIPYLFVAPQILLFSVFMFFPLAMRRFSACIVGIHLNRPGLLAGRNYVHLAPIRSFGTPSRIRSSMWWGRSRSR